MTTAWKRRSRRREYFLPMTGNSNVGDLDANGTLAPDISEPSNIGRRGIIGELQIGATRELKGRPGYPERVNDKRGNSQSAADSSPAKNSSVDSLSNIAVASSVGSRPCFRLNSVLKVSGASIDSSASIRRHVRRRSP